MDSRAPTARATRCDEVTAELATRLGSVAAVLRQPVLDRVAVARLLDEVERCRELVAAAAPGTDDPAAEIEGEPPVEEHAPGTLRPANDGGDPRLARALAALRRRLGAPWTVAALARIAGMSRAAFARLFTRTLGAPPLRHLATMRMREAQRLLLVTDEGLAAIAGHLGYASEFAFSRAFKRHVGVAPAIHRRRERERRSAAGGVVRAAQLRAVA